jgi:two-component system, cell cycle sensor histidine kinase and response regulator CckA
MLNRIIGEQITCHYYFTPDLPYIYADQNSLEQIMINLAINARDTMGHDGTLIVNTSEVTINGDYVTRVPDAWEGRHVCLSVTDTGQGIDPKIWTGHGTPFLQPKM